MSKINLTCKIVNVKYCGKLKLYIQGDEARNKPWFITVHDVGYNHNSFCDFISCIPMTEVAKRSVWVHVTLPGQDDYDETISEHVQYPSMDDIAHDILTVLDFFDLETVIGFGEGAGANILTRFALMHPNRCLGLVLIGCSGGTATFDERMQSTVESVEQGGKKLLAKARLLLHADKNTENEKFFTHNGLNPVNVSKYFQSYLKRTDISKWLSMDLTVDCFVIAGKNSPQRILCQEMVKYMDKIRTTLLIIDDVYDVLYEAQKELARSLILFCKGCGILLGVPMLGLEREFKKVHDKQKPNEAELQLVRRIQLYEAMLTNVDI